MSHAAASEDAYHRHHNLHHPNHRYAAAPRPILHRRTALHSGRQHPQGHTQCALQLTLCRHCPTAYIVPYLSQLAFGYPCGETPMPHGAVKIDMPA
jgi:hypothetical protein